MLKINKSAECSKSELDLFYVPPTQTSIEEGISDDIQPHSSFNTSDVIRFDIVGDSSHFLNLAETELHIVGYIKQKESELGIEPKTKLGPVNNFLHSLFSQINISINNQNVENTNSAYSFRSYLENLISFNRIEKTSSLAGDIFYKDEAGKFDNFTVEPTTTLNSLVTKNLYNRGFFERHELTTSQKTIQLQVNHLMVNSTTITLMLKKNSPKFYLMGDEPADKKEYFFNYDDCFLRIRRQVISPSVMVAISKINEEFTFKYPIKRVVVRNFVIPESSVLVNIPKICEGILPRRVVVGLLKTTAYDGRYKENPFNFENLGITSMSLKVNSKSLPNTNGLKFDFVKNLYLDGYKSLCKLSPDLDITYQEYKEGYTLFAFDLNPDVSSCEHFSSLQDGIIDLTFQKLEAHKVSYTCICYCEYDNIIELNKHRQPSFDYII